MTTLADKIRNSGKGLFRSSTGEAIFFLHLTKNLRNMIGYNLTESRWEYPEVETAGEFTEILPKDLTPDEGFVYACLDPEVQKKIDARIKYEDSQTLYLNRRERLNLTKSSEHLIRAAKSGVYDITLASARIEE